MALPDRIRHPVRGKSRSARAGRGPTDLFPELHIIIRFSLPFSAHGFLMNSVTRIVSSQLEKEPCVWEFKKDSHISLSAEKERRDYSRERKKRRMNDIYGVIIANALALSLRR